MSLLTFPNAIRDKNGYTVSAPKLINPVNVWWIPSTLHSVRKQAIEASEVPRKTNPKHATPEGLADLSAPSVQIGHFPTEDSAQAQRETYYARYNPDFIPTGMTRHHQF